MTRVETRTNDAPPPAGPYSQGITSGPVIALAGQGGFDPETNELVGPAFADEAHRAFQNLMAVLRAAGSGPESVIRMGASFDPASASSTRTSARRTSSSRQMVGC